MNYKTEQENFWATKFGDEYIDRNQNWMINTPFFSKVLDRTNNVVSIIEFGCNIGLNLRAINLLKPEAKLTGVEINKKAVDILRNDTDFDIVHSSIFDYKIQGLFDMSMVRGLLIHINPDMLNVVYEKLYQSSKRYILIDEYYNLTPVSIDYRGESDKLFKRDFAGEMLEKYPDLELVDYGFNYHRDNNFYKEDTNWFLLRK